jgi:DNA polymerase-3 subunit alpha
MRKAVDLIEQRLGITYTMDNIPYDVDHVGPDPELKPKALFEMLGRGEVAGVFQVESPGMRRIMIRMKPQKFDHIVAAISLYRPGPIENIPEYLDRMHGKKKVEYHHPDLKPILEETYGIVVYQEQIIRIASEFAGYAPGEADLIRKAVAKKKRKLMDRHKSQFTDGAMSHGYSRATCEAIWADIEFFARYGVNKAHAADYAVITCQTAFLKAHYPVEYMTALMSVERNNTDKVAHYLAEARRMSIQVTPPTINEAKLDFIIEDDSSKPVIRYGLGAIKNAGTAAIEVILEDRSENGKFTSLSEFCERVDLRRVGKRALESMIKVGVFDEWGTRPQLLESLDRLISHSARTNDAAAAGQMSLFTSSAGRNHDIDVELLRPSSELKSIDNREVLNWEKELVGVYISEHPLNRYLELVSDKATIVSAELDVSMNGRAVKLLGLITRLRTYVTKKGESMAFGNLEDLHGTVELIFFPHAWSKCRGQVEVDHVYLVSGKVRLENGERAKLVVEKVEDSLTISNSNKVPPSPKDLPESAGPKSSVPGKKEPEPDVTLSPDEIEQSPSLKSRSPVSPMIPPANFEESAEFWLEDPQNTEMENTVLAKPLANKRISGVTSTRSPDVDSITDKKVAIRTILVEIEPLAEWQEACRLLVRSAGNYQGPDRLRIAVTGQKLLMDFPNQNTLCCEDLVQELSYLPGVKSVKAM